MLSSFLLSSLSIVLVTAGPTALPPQPLYLNFNVSASQFSSFESPSTFKQLFAKSGSNLNLNYNQLSTGVAAINAFFLQRSRSTTAQYNAGGFIVPEGSSPKPQNKSRSLDSNGAAYSSFYVFSSLNDVTVDNTRVGAAVFAGGATFSNTSYVLASSRGNEFYAMYLPTNEAIKANQFTNFIASNVSTDTAYDGPRYSYFGPQDPAVVASCAADATGATATAQLITTLTIPVNITGQNRTVTHIASGSCEAGVSQKTVALSNSPDSAIPLMSVGSSASGMQASPANSSVAASVSCRGQRILGLPMLSFALYLNGTYSERVGFVGTFVVVRNATASVACV